MNTKELIALLEAATNWKDLVKLPARVAALEARVAALESAAAAPAAGEPCPGCGAPSLRAAGTRPHPHPKLAAAGAQQMLMRCTAAPCGFEIWRDVKMGG